MNTKLHFTKQNSNTLFTLLVFCLCFNYGWSQVNLVQNSTCEDHTFDVNDNADAFDMTPPTGVDGGSNNSPYRAIWNNSALDSWLGTNCGDTNEQPGSTSDGNKFGPLAGLGRGVKIASTCRRLYQVIPVTMGTNYTFFIDSRSEETGVPSEVFILNTEIVDEAGLTSGSASVDAYIEITNDYNATKSSDTEDTFTTTSIAFTATSNIAVIYVRAPLAVDSAHEVFYDNISLFDTSSLSVNDAIAGKISVYPNPANNFIKIDTKNSLKISSLEIYDILGQKVLSQNGLKNNQIDISNLSSGVHFLKIYSDGQSITKKIIKE